MCNSVYECTWGSNTWTCKIQLLIGVKNYYDNMTTDVEFLAILFPVQPEHIATHTASSLAFSFSVAGNFSQRINLQEEEYPGRLKRTVRSQNWRTFLLAVTEGVTVNITLRKLVIYYCQSICLPRLLSLMKDFPEHEDRSVAYYRARLISK